MFMPEVVAAISVGNTRDPVSPVIEAFSQYGISIKRSTVKSWRHNIASGNGTQYRVDAAKLLQTDDALNKDYTYLSITKSAVRTRRMDNPPRHHVYASGGLINIIAADARMTPFQTEAALRAIRTEVILESSRLDTDHQAIFGSVVEKIIEDYSNLTPSMQPAILTSLRELQQEDIRGVYKLFYARKARRTIGSLVPYECTFLRYFYQNRIAQGSQLSTYDRVALTSILSDEPIDEVIKRLREETGISIFLDDIAIQRSFLLYGKPTIPYRPRP